MTKRVLTPEQLKANAEYMAAYRAAHPEYAEKCRKQMLAANKKRYNTDKEYRQYVIDWQRAPENRKKTNDRVRKRYKEDLEFRLHARELARKSYRKLHSKMIQLDLFS